jgi:putative NIF3 family GTP cyclohydrolase 1 type 2
MVGEAGKKIEHVAVVCGSAGTFLGASRAKGCQALLTGETTFHTCLAAEAEEMVLFLAGHFASERFAMQGLAEDLTAEFKDLRIWASQNEKDPLQLL